MDKDYEIIQNISLAEKKEQVAPEAAPVVTVTPPGEEVAPSPVIETPTIATPEVAIQVPEQAAPIVAVPEVKLEIPGMDVPAVEETPVAVEVAPTVEEPVTVEPTYEKPVVVAEEPTPEYSYGDNTSDDEYKSMFANTDVEVPAYNNYGNNYNDSYENSYNSAPSYTAESVVSVDINFKDENSINNYYDQKREASINEIEKERAAALDQCKKYQEMANWVNDIGSSFNFFKGRSGY